MSSSKRYYAIIGRHQVGEWKQHPQLIQYDYIPRIDPAAAILEVQNELKKEDLKFHIFDTKEEADNYALDTALHRRNAFNVLNSDHVVNKNDARLKQHIVVEISVPYKKIDAAPMDEKHPEADEKANNRQIITEKIYDKDYCLKPRVNNTAYSNTEMKNDPATFITHQAWIGTQSLGSVCKFPVSYQRFFQEPNVPKAIAKKDPLVALKDLFDDYIAPKKWYAKHHVNRHNVLKAQQVLEMIARNQEPPEILLNKLIAKREEYILAARRVTSTFFTYGYEDFMKGSFKKRLDFAINRLKDGNISLTSEPEPKKAETEMAQFKSG